VRNSLLSAKEETWALFRVLRAHPALEIDMANSQLTGAEESLFIESDAVTPIGKIAVVDGIVYPVIT